MDIANDLLSAVSASLTRLLCYEPFCLCVNLLGTVGDPIF